MTLSEAIRMMTEGETIESHGEGEVYINEEREEDAMVERCARCGKEIADRWGAWTCSICDRVYCEECFVEEEWENPTVCKSCELKLSSVSKPDNDSTNDTIEEADENTFSETVSKEVAKNVYDEVTNVDKIDVHAVVSEGNKNNEAIFKVQGQDVKTLTFKDLSCNVSYIPMYIGNNEFTNYYMVNVNNENISPVSANFSVIKTQFVVDTIKNLLAEAGVKVRNEETTYNKTYLKHTLTLDYEFDLGESPFESEWSNYDISLSDVFDYHIPAPDDTTNDSLGIKVHIYNSYSGACRLFVDFEIFRFICENGLIVSDRIHELRIKHNSTTHNIEKQLSETIPILIKNAVESVGKVKAMMGEKISVDDAVNMIIKAKKFGIGERYVKKLEDSVIVALQTKFSEISKFALWNILTYQIARSKTLRSIPTRQRNTYSKVFKEIESL